MTLGAIYGMGHIDHLFILGGEIMPNRNNDDDQKQAVLRQFLSEPELSHHRLEESKTGYIKKVSTVSGFASIAWTSTREPQQFHDEFVLRLTSVRSNEGADTTQAVMDLKAKRAEDPLSFLREEKAVIERFNLFDLSLAPLPVIVPFSKCIKLANDDTSARGIYELLLQHTQISALINQHKRKSAKGCILADWPDYEAAYELVQHGAYKVQDPLSENARAEFTKLLKHAADSNADTSTVLTNAEICNILDRPRTTVNGWIRQWLNADMLEMSEEARGKKRYWVTGTLPEAKALGLITPETARAVYEQSGADVS